jgi:hypothetical protein
MRKISALMTVAVALAAAGCGSSSSSSTGSAGASGPATTSGSGSTTSAKTGGVNPNQHETLPPGDIPDTIAYVPYTVPGAGLTVSTPEGWSRSNTRGAVKFTDKLNAIQLFTAPASGPVSTASAKSNEVPKIASDPVTGKVGTLAFERYDFFHRGKEVVLLLSSPKGSDNVDPWKKVTSSLRFAK